VDDLSSAHVYLRLPESISLETIPEATLEDAAQLVKANSIQGCKMSRVDIVFTPASNLRKSASMDVGQVGFHNQSLVKRRVVEKSNDIVNRLNRTKLDRQPDLAAERQAWDREQRSKAKAELQARAREEKDAKNEQQRQQELKAYTAVLTKDALEETKARQQQYISVEDYEDDFM
jgi:hypothetical protein